MSGTEEGKKKTKKGVKIKERGAKERNGSLQNLQ